MDDEITIENWLTDPNDGGQTGMEMPVRVTHLPSGDVLVWPGIGVTGDPIDPAAGNDSPDAIDAALYATAIWDEAARDDDDDDGEPFRVVPHTDDPWPTPPDDIRPVGVVVRGDAWNRDVMFAALNFVAAAALHRAALHQLRERAKPLTIPAPTPAPLRLA